MEIAKRTENFEFVKIVNVWNEFKIVYKEIETQTIKKWIDEMNKEQCNNQNEPLTHKDFEVNYYCDSCKEIQDYCRCTEFW